MSKCTMNTQCGYRDYRIQVYTDDYQLYDLIEMQIVKIREAYMNKDDLSHAIADNTSEIDCNKLIDLVLSNLSLYICDQMYDINQGWCDKHCYSDDRPNRECIKQYLSVKG